MNARGMWRRILAARHGPLWYALLACVLALPALTVGLQGDDHFHRAVLTRPEAFAPLLPPKLELFSFSDGGARTERLIRAGWLPWWTDPGLRISFFRPLAALTHYLDYRLWPEHPALMHLQSIVWLGLLVGIGAVAYRRLMGPVWVAGLAALMFAVEDTHGFPTGWLAARNSVGASAFALLAVTLHASARTPASLKGLVLAPLALAGGLLFGETALGALGFLLAYAICLDSRRWRTRLLSLLPYAVVTAAWLVVYHMHGSGVSGSGWYVDPVEEPLRFIAALVERAPILLLGQFGLITADVYMLLSTTARIATWIGAILLLGALGALLLKVLWHDRLARFWTLGMVIALLPAALSIPSDRLLILVGFGAMGLLARFVARVAQGGGLIARILGSNERDIAAPPLPWPRAARIIATCVLLIHVVVAPLLLPWRAWSAGQLGQLETRCTAGLPNVDAQTGEAVVIVNSPSALLTGLSLPDRRGPAGAPVRVDALVLCASVNPVRVTCINEHTLEVRPEGGVLERPGTPPTQAAGLNTWFNLTFMVQHLDEIVRGPQRPFRTGDFVSLSGATAEVTEVTATGRPQTMLFRFDKRLDSPTLHWLVFADGRLGDFILPTPGETVVVPGAQLELRDILSAWTMPGE